LAETPTLKTSTTLQSRLNDGLEARRPLPLIAAFTITIAGCSSSSSGSPAPSADSGADSSPAMINEETDGSSDASTSETPVSDAHAGGSDAASPSDAHAAADAKNTTSPGVDAGDAPAGQAGVAAYCAAVCDRQAVCYQVALDAATCNCSQTGTLTVYRSDYLANLAACASSASCEDLMTDASDSGLDTCEESALAQITPTAAVTALCTQVGLSTSCDDAVPDCPDTFKYYSDQAVNAVSACIADPNCNDHTACITTALNP
jgi:hypothetical protein